MKRLLWVLAAVVIGACKIDTIQAANDPSDPATESFAPSLRIDVATMQKTAAGTYYKDVVVGSGPAFSSSQPIVISFNAFLKNGAAFLSGEQQTVNLSDPGFPFGLQDGLAGMSAGGERLLVIPSALGYGNATVGGVPPNSTLVFDVRLDLIP